MNWLPALRLASALLFVMSIALGILVVRAMNDSRHWVIAASNGIMDFSLAERTLRVDLLDARAGLLRNYDPLNADLAAAGDSLSDLDQLPIRHPEARARIAQLKTKAAEQEGVVEKFNSDNALLQNSLTRFTANEKADVGQDGRLSARILKLTLDTSPQTVNEANAALARMPEAVEGTPAAQFVSHARLLVAILPEIDRLLHAVCAMQMEKSVEALRTLLVQETRTRQILVMRLQASLATTLLLLIGCVIALAMVVRLRTRELNMRAANERLSAAVATPLIDAGRETFVSRAQEAVRLLAVHIGATRLQLMIPGVPNFSLFSWPEHDLDPNWLRKLVNAADTDDAWEGGEVIVSRASRKRNGALDQAMLAAGVRDLVMIRAAAPYRVLVGFEAGGKAMARRRDHAAAVGSAIVAIAHGARREIMLLDRERLQRQLARSRRMETIGAMASGVAHNFNNIIGAIGGFAEMGQESSRLNSPARYNFDEIRDAVRRGRDLVDDILSFARQGRSNKRRISLAEVLIQAARLLSASSRDEDVFRLVPPKDSYLMIGAGSDLQQVILNIGNNAAQISGGRPVAIGSRRFRLGREQEMSHGTLDPGDYVVVSIADHGPGVPAAAFPRLFEPFFTTRAGGTGLGLSTAWEIVQDHGGTIDVENVPAGGACFSIWLPVLSTDAELPLILAGARILLLADDDHLAAEEELLAELGYEPFGFAISTDVVALREILLDCDAVLIATGRSEIAADLVAGLAPVIGGRPLLVAAPDILADDLSVPILTLDYPIVAENLAGLLVGRSRGPALAHADL